MPSKGRLSHCATGRAHRRSTQSKLARVNTRHSAIRLPYEASVSNDVTPYIGGIGTRANCAVAWGMPRIYQVSTDNVHSLQPYAELTLDKAFGNALKPVNVQLRVGYARQLLDAGRAVSVASQDGTLFTAPGTSLPRGYLHDGSQHRHATGVEPLRSRLAMTLINTTHASAQ